MREILFRGKRSNGEWAYGWYYPLRHDKDTITHYMVENPLPALRGVKESVVDPFTIGQFTGLTDKNGKKIFEGDILKVVELHDGDEDYWNQPCGPAIPTVAEWGSRGWCLPYRVTADFAVIGNIYDNPELIGDKNE